MQHSHASSTTELPNHGISKCYSFWHEHVQFFQDQTFAKEILQIVKYGASIGCEGCTERTVHMNWPSTQQFYNGVCEYIATHQASGAIVGPLKAIPEGFHTSPLGAFIRKGSSKLRVIHDLSWPPGQSVNDCINKEDYSVVYTSVAEAVRLCQQLNTPWLAKTDLQDAYLSCPVNPAEAHVLGFSWSDGSGKTHYYRYNSIALGLRSSAKIFDLIASALRMISINRGASSLTIHYLDDILTLSNSKLGCEQSLNIIIDTAEKCGFKVKASKTVGPVRTIELL